MNKTFLIIFSALTMYQFSRAQSCAACSTYASGNVVSSLRQINWGQSFEAKCSGNLQTITFNSATDVLSSATFTLYDGPGCNADILYRHNLKSIVNGDNTVTITEPINVYRGRMYFFDVKTDNNQRWKIRFNNYSQMSGELKTHSSYGSCARRFPSFDWNSSVAIANIPPETIDLFIWAGQSNAQGWSGNAAYYPKDITGMDNQTRLNYTFIGASASNGWTKMKPQIGRYPSGHFGAEVTFSRSLLRAGYNPAIFKYTRGSTSIAYHWKTPGAGGYYDNMIVKLNHAISQLERLGHTVIVRGFVWIQGESDTGNSAVANAYQERLERIIDDLRNRVNTRVPVSDSRLPIILGVDEQHQGIVAQPAVLAAHHNIAANDENIKFTSMYGFPKDKPGGTHLTPAGLIAQGRRIGDAMLCLLDNSACNDNLALMKTATQSSTGAGGVAFYAVDGNTNGHYHLGKSVTHTRLTNNSWWKVDLEKQHNLGKIKVYNRTDCCSDRLRGAKLLVGNINSSNPSDYTEIATLSNEYEQEFDLDIIARYIMLYHPTRNKFLSIAELQAFASEFKYANTLGVLDRNTTIPTGEYRDKRIYPNPTTGILKLQDDFNEFSAIKIYDMLGQDITANIPISRIDESIIEIDLTSQKSGWYIINSGNNTYKVHKNR